MKICLLTISYLSIIKSFFRYDCLRFVWCYLLFIMNFKSFETIFVKFIIFLSQNMIFFFLNILLSTSFEKVDSWTIQFSNVSVFLGNVFFLFFFFKYLHNSACIYFVLLTLLLSFYYNYEYAYHEKMLRNVSKTTLNFTKPMWYTILKILLNIKIER